jgi:hypothetical protein
MLVSPKGQTDRYQKYQDQKAHGDECHLETSMKMFPFVSQDATRPVDSHMRTQPVHLDATLTGSESPTSSIPSAGVPADFAEETDLRWLHLVQR